jgi:hypothetical protein
MAVLAENLSNLAGQDVRVVESDKNLFSLILGQFRENDFQTKALDSPTSTLHFRI